MGDSPAIARVTRTKTLNLVLRTETAVVLYINSMVVVDLLFDTAMIDVHAIPYMRQI